MKGNIKVLVKILSPDFVIENENGMLKQLVHEGWNQVNVITSIAGSKRGGHYHKINKEAFYIIYGNLKLTIQEKDRENIKAETYQFKAGDMFLLMPYQKHYFEYLEDTILVAMYDQGVENKDGTKDIYEMWE